MPTLGRFIRRRRIELGMTQEQMAEMLGVSVRQSEISRLENDRITLPRRERLERIAEVLDVPIGELLARSGWTGADTALANLAPPSLPPQAVPTVMELIDEIKGLLGEIQGILGEEDLSGASRQGSEANGKAPQA